MKDLSTIELIKHNKALTAFSCLFIIVFILLGFWQIERAGFKASLIQEFDLEQAKAPKPTFPNGCRQSESPQTGKPKRTSLS